MWLRGALVVSAIILSAGCAATSDRTYPVVLGPATGVTESDVRRAVADAERIVGDFAAAHGWAEHARDPVFERAEVFADQASLWSRILALHSLPAETKMPTAGLAAGIERGVLLAVSPAEYRRIRPEYATAPVEWTRLIAHEIAHRVHVRILGGAEERMGPPWFFEGFATLASGQRIGTDLRYRSAAEALAATRDPGRGAYARFAAALRFFAGRAPLAELVRRAGDADFEAWLRGS